AGYSPRFWGLVVVIGAGTGLAGAGFIALLTFIERTAWRRSSSHFLGAAGVGSLALRRLQGSGGGEISEALWLRGARLDLIPSLVRGAVSIVTVGMGASLGREAAPQLAGAAL